ISAWASENNTRPSGLRYAEIMRFSSGRFLRLNRSAHEERNSRNRHHRRQRPVSDRGITRRHRTQDRHAIWAAIRYAGRRNAARAFSGEGIAAHIAFAEPISANLRNLLAESARSLGVTVHNGGTYVNMDGPAFSTRAESEFNRRNGFDVIAMTNLPEAKLAREAEIAFATMAMITDYDCWKVEEEPVSAQTVLSHLVANAETARKVIANVVPQVP